MTARSAPPSRLYQVRMWPKDLGVVLVVLVALLLGVWLRWQTESRLRSFQDPNSSFRIEYPTTWTLGELAGENELLRISDPRALSAFKTTVVVESRLLDPASLPTLQQLRDRRVEQHGDLVGYHFLGEQETTVDGIKAQQLEYAYVEQPIEQARRESLPVVVRAREYLVVATDRSFYLTLAAPEQEFERASRLFEQMLATVNIQ